MPILTDKGIITDPPLIAEPILHDIVAYHIGKATLEQLPLIPPSQLAFSAFGKIAEVEVTANLNYIEFTGLDINKHKLYCLVGIPYNAGSNDSLICLFVEGNLNPSNYLTQALVVDGSSISALVVNYPEVCAIRAGQTLFFICYLNLAPDGYFRFQSFSHRDLSTIPKMTWYAGVSKFTLPNITTIRLQIDQNTAFGNGSRFILLGLTL